MPILYLDSQSIDVLTVTSSFVLPKFTVDPTDESGAVYFNTSNNTAKVKTSTVWSDAGTVGGSSGTSGVHNTSGTSGVHNSSGTSGNDQFGVGGTSGTSGSSRSSGTSGTSGGGSLSGTAGTSGTSRSSGTSGQSGTGAAGNGTSGTSGGTFATQADQETGTSTTTIVSPGRQQFHNSSAKFWIVGQAGSINIQASYNVTSWNNVGTGQGTVTIENDFSSANWCGLVSIVDSTLAWDATYTTHQGFGAQAAGTCRVDCSRMQDGNTAAASLQNPTNWFVIGFGDLP